MGLNQFGVTQLVTRAEIEAAIRRHLKTKGSWLFAFSPADQPGVEEFRKTLIRLGVNAEGTKIGRFDLQDADTGDTKEFGLFLIPKANMPAAVFAQVADALGQPVPVLSNQAGFVITNDPAAMELFCGLMALCRPRRPTDPSLN